MKKLEPLSYQNTYCLKGILAMLILSVHLATLITPIFGTLIQTVWSPFGYLSVTMFFFLSAYGLASQYQKKGELYLKGFFTRKILPFYVYCMSVSLIYIVVKRWIGLPDSTKNILLSFVLMTKVVMFGWFLTVILGCYLIFYLTFRFCKKPMGRIIIIFVISVIYYVLCTVFEAVPFWYISIFGFALGFFWKEKEQQIKNLYNKKTFSVPVTLILLIVMAVSFFFSSTVYVPKVFIFLAHAVFGLTFVCLTVIILRYVPIQNAVTHFFGKISLEIYVFQGLFFFIFRDSRFAVQQWPAQVALTLLGTILLSWLLHPVLQLLQKKTATVLTKHLDNPTHS